MRTGDVICWWIVSSGLNRALSGMGWIAGMAAVTLACRTVAGEDLFATHPVWTIEIELLPQSIDRLRAESRKFVPASVRAFGEVFRDVGVHLKGTGSYRPIDDKPSFTL